MDDHSVDIAGFASGRFPSRHRVQSRMNDDGAVVYIVAADLLPSDPEGHESRSRQLQIPNSVNLDIECRTGTRPPFLDRKPRPRSHLPTPIPAIARSSA